MLRPEERGKAGEVLGGVQKRLRGRADVPGQELHRSRPELVPALPLEERCAGGADAVRDGIPGKVRPGAQVGPAPRAARLAACLGHTAMIL